VVLAPVRGEGFAETVLRMTVFLSFLLSLLDYIRAIRNCDLSAERGDCSSLNSRSIQIETQVLESSYAASRRCSLFVSVDPSEKRPSRPSVESALARYRIMAYYRGRSEHCVFAARKRKTETDVVRNQRQRRGRYSS